MNIPESFYIALCMTVLLLGVVYWFWSQNQYIQRKMNLLENIVYELKELCTNQTSFDGPPAELKTTKYTAPLETVHYAPPPVVEHTQLNETLVASGQDLHELLMTEVQDLEEKEEHVLEQPFFVAEERATDLQPGGVGSGMKDLDVHEQPSSLDSMTVKELRRLAEQRGVENASELRKKELIAKLRALAAPPTTSIIDAFNAQDETPDELQAIELE